MAETTDSISKHCLELTRPLIDDIELSRLSPEQFLLKAIRLVRSVLRVLVRVRVTRVVGVALLGYTLSWLAGPQERGLVDLVAVDCVRDGLANFLLRDG